MKKIFLLLLIAGVFTCKRKPPETDFLSPFERDKEGFLDSDTYQVFGESFVFAPEKSAINLKAYIPPLTAKNFDQKSLDEYNQRLKDDKTTPEKIRTMPEEEQPLLLKETMAAELDEIPQSQISLSLIDKKLKKMVDIRKALINQSCEQAKVRALYRWFILSVQSPVLEKDKKWNSIFSENRYKAGVTAGASDLPMLTSFNSRLFPPLPYFTPGMEEALNFLEKKLQKDSLAYEVIDEIKPGDNTWGCKSIVHIKKSGLLLDSAFLLQNK